MRPSQTVLTVVLVVLSVGLAGCIGGGGQDPGPEAPTNGGGGGGNGGTGTGGGNGNGGTGGGGNGGTGGGNGNGGSGGNGGGQDNGSTARTPSDAMPGHEPVETGEGFAHFQVQGTASLTLSALFYSVGPCERSVQGNPISTGGPCEHTFNLSLQGDETLVEVLLEWGNASSADMLDLNLHLIDHQRNPVSSGGHGQVFINQFCGVIGECIFVFPPNGTTWEYAVAGPDDLAEVEGPSDGNWLIQVTEENNWSPEALQAGLGTGEGPTWTLDVRVWTVPAVPSHNPATGGG